MKNLEWKKKIVIETNYYLFPKQKHSYYLKAKMFIPQKKKKEKKLKSILSSFTTLTLTYQDKTKFAAEIIKNKGRDK